MPITSLDWQWNIVFTQHKRWNYLKNIFYMKLSDILLKM